MRLVEYVAETHYPLAYAWWKKATGKVLDPSQLSDSGLVAVADDGRFVAISWLFHGNSKVAHIGFTVASPTARPREKILAIDDLIKQHIKNAAALGMRYVLSNSDRPALTKLLANAGFVLMEQHSSLSHQIGYDCYGDKEIF